MILLARATDQKRPFSSKFQHSQVHNKKAFRIASEGFSLAEGEGFEPPDLLQSTVFKTAAFDRSAIPLD
jgi:hypothetical protein